MNKKSIGISLNSLLLFVFWSLYFLPLALTHIQPRAEYIALVVRMPVVIVSLLNIKGGYFSQYLKKGSYLFFIVVMLIWNLFCILINTPEYILSYLADAYQLVELVVVMLYSFRTYGLSGLKPLYYVSIVYILLSFVIMVAYPNGLYISNVASSTDRAQWLFGSKNNVGVYNAVFCFVIILFRTKCSVLSRLFTGLVIFISCYCVASAGDNRMSFLEGSSTGILMCIVIVFTLFISNTRKFSAGKQNLITPNKIVVFSLLANLILVCGLSISFVNDFIVEVFHKSDTFSGRTYVWASVIKYIGKSPIIGHGITRVVFYGSVLTSTYNVFLGIIKAFGIPSAFIFFVALKSIKPSTDRNIQIALIGLATCFLNGLMSQVSLSFLVFFMTLACLLYNNETNAKK